MGDVQAPDRLSSVGRRCVAGLMHHHPGLAALLAPTVNSYARLQPASLSGYWRNWGHDHRGVTTRITQESGPHARIEHRMADGASNPYTMVASILQAALLGDQNNYPLIPAETADCLDNHDAEDGVPNGLESALEALEADSKLVAAVGEDLVGNLAVIKRDEICKTANFNHQQLRDFYIYFI